MLIGFGLFKLVEGVVNDQLLGLNHVNETVPRERRTEVVGNLPNEAAIPRLVGAILLEQNDVYGPPPPCKAFLNGSGEASACSRVSGLAARYFRPQALMVFADQQPDKWTNSKVRIVSWALADPGPTGSPSSFSHPRKPDARRLWASGFVRRHAPPVSNSFLHVLASPKRPEPFYVPVPSPRPGRDVAPKAATARAAA
jgi:hypothetical protein